MFFTLAQLSVREVFFTSSCVLRKLRFSTHYSMKNPNGWRLTATTLQNFCAWRITCSHGGLACTRTQDHQSQAKLCSVNPGAPSSVVFGKKLLFEQTIHDDIGACFGQKYSLIFTVTWASTIFCLWAIRGSRPENMQWSI